MSFTTVNKMNSRIGKKQVVAFLSPNQAKSIRDTAYAENKTVQEVLGDSINAVFIHHKLKPPFNTSTGRIIRRVNGRASIRSLSKNPACRSGKVSVGGWFAQDEVDELTKFSARLGVSNQAFVQFGITLITDVEPDDDGWKLASLPPSEISSNVRLRGRPKIEGVIPRKSKNLIQDAILVAKEKLAEIAYN